ncbi:Oxysterol-binding protein [Sistotremastrum niveocremeum HHB9708]|uniref:Oxysterol-binding protein n=2 Tax=Sistotremastraceae TaxID=3402574 RepID=A0A164WVI7_9AGAM|nr:Oxysterol-binding protein [Sistotremastrum niveocremeum HHB9708]KZT39819.1 Oxysterol-binding protein [Sistotremastrum suecicum HHB10207 ss-3]
MSNTENNEEPGAAVPAGQKGSWTSFLKAIASFSGDLSSLTAPPFILSPVSLTEFPAYWCERPELFAAISSGKNEEERALLVLKWFISTLKGQYSSRNEKMGSEKKPLNPVLGEVFFGTWPDRDGRGETRLIVEQVSHHPPVTAYHIQNASKGVTLQGHSAQKTSFSGGSIVVKQIGHAILDVKLESGVSEKYLITLPTLNIQGVWLGSPYTELGGSSVIQSSSGWNASIEYKGKGYFSGKVHSFKATLSHPHSHHHPHVVEGQWSTTSTPKTNISSSRVLERNGCFTDVNGPKEEVTVKSIEEQGPWESRNLWKVVSAGIRTGDFDTAAKDKSRIENEQRQRRKDEREAGTSWDLLYFDHVDEDPIYEKLAAMGQIVPATEDGYILKDAPLPHPPR